jgi:hypothetical protein
MRESVPVSNAQQPFVAHAVYQILPLARKIVDLLAGDAAVNRSLLTYADKIKHGKHLAYVDRTIGNRQCEFFLCAHQTAPEEAAFAPFLTGGTWIITQMAGEAHEHEVGHEFLRQFATGSGGVYHSATGPIAPQTIPRIDGIDSKKIALMRKIGPGHAPAIEAMLSHPEITVQLPLNPVKYPPASEISFGCSSTKQCF